MATRTKNPTYFVGLVWAGALVKRARAEKKILNDNMVLALIEEINKLRCQIGDLLCYDWVNIPLSLIHI